MENAKCDAILSSITTKERDEIYEQGILLRDDQIAVRDVSVLPSVKLAGI